MSRQDIRNIIHGKKEKVLPKLSRGYTLQMLLSNGTGHKVGERITLSDGSEYIIKQAEYQHRNVHFDKDDNAVVSFDENPNKGVFVRLSAKAHRRYRKAKLIEPQYPEVKYQPRQHLHIDKATRKNMTSEQILEMRKASDSNFIVNHPVMGEKNHPLDEKELQA